MSNEEQQGMPAGVSHLIPVDTVILAEDVRDVPAEVERSISEQDDRYWSAVIMRRPFSWQGFLEWWIARRWLEPRDVTRR